MTRSLVCASLVGFFATPAWAGAELPSTTDATGSSVVVLGDDAPDASAGARGGGGGGRGGGGGGKGGGGGGGHAGGGKGSHAGGSHAGGKGGSHAHAPRSGDKPAASRHGNSHMVSNHPSRSPSRSSAAAHAPSRTPAHAPSRTVANKTVHPGSPPRAMHNPAAHGAHYAPAHHHAVIFPRWMPSYGVFVYSPPPARRVVVVDGHRQVVESSRDDLRAVNRNGDVGIGFTTGSYMSTYRYGEGSYGDFGLGVNLTYRPVEALGLEVAWSHHTETWDSNVQPERESDPLSASAKMYAMPWTRVSPYLSLGCTWTHRQFDDTYSDGFTTQTESVDDTLIGPHVGLGLELAIGRSAALDFEGRMIGYVNKDPADPAAPFAGQATGGLKLYF